jgi:hypothetical protein
MIRESGIVTRDSHAPFLTMHRRELPFATVLLHGQIARR